MANSSVIQRLYAILVLFFLLAVVPVYAGYYDAVTASNANFITDLQTRIRSPYTRITYDNYDETNIANYASYVYSGSQRAVRCVYSNYEYVYSGTFAWGVFSREHTWCASWMPNESTSSQQYSDQHHLFPTQQNDANGIRSNHQLGKVITVTKTFYEGKYGTDSTGDPIYEPRDPQKGNSARALLYMAVKYNGVGGLNWTFSALSVKMISLSEKPQSLEVLLKWHHEDPPDKGEVERNDYVQSIQQNRNPFVDHPEYADYINFWTIAKINPAFVTEPTNHLSNLTTGSINGTYITLNWTDAASGTQAPSGYMVLAYDTNNYFIPEDGVTYTEDTNLSDGKAIAFVAHPSAGNYTFTSLHPNTNYYFRVYPYNGTGTTINYKIDGTIPSMMTTTIPSSLAPEPTNHATAFSVVSVTTGAITLNWANAIGATLPSGYLLSANNIGSFSNPVDGNSYADDSQLSDGSAMVNINYSSANTTYTFNNLLANQVYYFKIYSYNSTNSMRNYKTDGTVPSTSTTTLPVPIMATAITLDPSSITPTTATGNGSITNLGYPNPTHYGLVWDTNATPTIALGTKTDNGAASAIGAFTGALTSLSAQTLYYIRSYVTNPSGTAYGNEVQFYTFSSDPSGHVTGFNATAVSTSQINLSWTTTFGASGYLVLLKQGANPTGTPSDANDYIVDDILGNASVCAVLNTGNSASASITGLTPNAAYTFSIFPYRWDGINMGTYNYLTSATIPLATATTQALPDMGPGVIINEFSQGASGAKEWVEILVTQDNYNLQNYKLVDSNGSLSITLSGSGFSNIAKGTLIVLYNGGDVDTLITPDLTYNGGSDKVLQISSLNASGTWAITRTTGWNNTTGAFANASATDVPRLITASGDTVFSFPRTPTPAGGMYSAYTGNTVSGATIASNWTADIAYGSATPGSPNGGINTTWIMGMGGVPVELSLFTTEPDTAIKE